MRKLLVLGLLVFIIISLLIVKFPHTMLSPGELIQGHQKFNNDCFACHDAFKSICNQKCIACHELKKMDNKKRQNKVDSFFLLNSNFHTSIRQFNCTSCHKDHIGLNSDIATKFDHNILEIDILENCISCHKSKEDYLHRNVSGSCLKCHTTQSWKKISKFDHNSIKNQVLNDCAACHKAPKDDIHSNYQSDCNICHSMIKWSPAKIEHSSYFQLDRDHNVKCNICHKNKSYKSYTCYGCHEHTIGNIAEEHREEGIYNFSNCAECHKDANEDNAKRYQGSYNKSKTYQSSENNEDDDD